MKQYTAIIGLAAVLWASAASADTYLRIKCEDEDVGAVVTINDKDVGACPIEQDPVVRAGKVTIRARLPVGNMQEKLFFREINLIEGQPQRINIIMSPPQLTAAGRAAEAVAAAAAAAAAQQRLVAEEASRPIEAGMVDIPGRAFRIGRTEVTQKLWRDVMGSNPSHFGKCGDTCPVEQVNWDDIQTFLEKLNARTGKQYRLPTEAEWDYACRGGSQTEYCGGNDLDTVGWYGNDGAPGGNSGQASHPVAQKQANGYGLYDMSGNVWEWVSDCYDSSCRARTLCGGSWHDGPLLGGAAFRGYGIPEGRLVNIGFRLARTLP